MPSGSATVVTAVSSTSAAPRISATAHASSVSPAKSVSMWTFTGDKLRTFIPHTVSRSPRPLRVAAPEPTRVEGTAPQRRDPVSAASTAKASGRRSALIRADAASLTVEVLLVAEPQGSGGVLVAWNRLMVQHNAYPAAS